MIQGLEDELVHIYEMELSRCRASMIQFEPENTNLVKLAVVVRHHARCSGTRSGAVGGGCGFRYADGRGAAVDIGEEGGAGDVLWPHHQRE